MPIQRDYRDYPNPRMFSWEIIVKMKNQGKQEFTAREVADAMGLSIAEACTRLAVLTRYECLKRNSMVYPYLYSITEWGNRYTDRKIKRGKEKKK